MIENKNYLIASGMILILCMSFYFPFPNAPMVYKRMAFMSFPIQDQDGYNVLAIIGSFLFIFAIVLLVIGLSNYHIRTVMVVAIVYSLLPFGLIKVYQETVADGINAISYNGKGTCDFEKIEEEEFTGECNLLISNHSGEPVTFDIEFLDTFFPGSETRFTSLMNENGPYTVTIEANRKKSVSLKEVLDLSDIPNHVDGGSSTEVHFKIEDGSKERIM
ncbi:hypothetical protein [Rossellomorea sp. KS-H15a]|uniref:hypothetical protein n=1 Tax=Rossellomorea sp. KS-H15a TaxID=2963940 RepID=UPI0020C715EE|nr:hypothetical protein [Rossellomorea sp. KS-H15a]UTE78592.1 hypothetical protein M1J35_07485 [Rossellomorea sp. KS-H15a]